MVATKIEFQKELPLMITLDGMIEQEFQQLVLSPRTITFHPFGSKIWPPVTGFRCEPSFSYQKHWRAMSSTALAI